MGPPGSGRCAIPPDRTPDRETRGETLVGDPGRTLVVSERPARPLDRSLSPAPERRPPMETPLELTFGGVDRNEEREDPIREKVAKLEQVCDTITSCRVTVKKAQESQQTGNPLDLRIEVRVPRHNEILVNQKMDADQAADPFGRLVRDAFQAAQRKLQEVTERQRGEIKP